MSKTSGKSSEQLKRPELVPQAHGGALQRGGTPGNPGGGRKPNKFVAECARAADEDVLPKCVEYLRTHQLADDAAAWKWAAEYVTNYGKGRPVQPIDTEASVPHEEALDALDREPE